MVSKAVTLTTVRTVIWSFCKLLTRRKVQRMVPVGLVTNSSREWEPVGKPPGPSFLTCILWGGFCLVCFPRFWMLPQDNCLSSFWHLDKWEDVSCLPDSYPNFILCSVKLLAKFFPLVLHILTDVRAPSAKICKQLAFMFEHTGWSILKLKFS